MPTPQAEETLTAALAAAARGWHVFPLTPGSKRPAVTGWESRATTETARIQRCWSTLTSAGPYGVGIACGPSELLVVDLDTPKGRPTPPEWRRAGIVDGADVLAVVADQHGAGFPWDTHTVATPSGGMHLYFTQPEGQALRNTAGRLGWLVDTRGAGGYVVAAGTTLDTGAYATVDDADSVHMPDWLAAALRAEPTPPPTGTGIDLAALRRRSRYAAAALAREVDAVLSARLGSRNTTLNAAAYALGRLVATDLLPSGLAAAALTQAAHAVGLPEAEAAATIASGLAAGARHPRHHDQGRPA
jgi:hypothetical protein